MGTASILLFVYLSFLSFTFFTGLLFWVQSRDRVLAVLALIFSLLAPLLSLFIAAQNETNSTGYYYILNEIGAGNMIALIHLLLHIYLFAWMIYLSVRLILEVVKE